MADTLEKLKVVIEASASPLEKESKKAISSTRSMVKSINKTLKGVSKTPLVAVDNNKTMVQLRNMKNLLKKTFSDVKSGELTEGISNSVKNYVKEAQMASGIKVYTEDYKNICNDVERADKALNKLYQKQRDLEAAGVDKESKEWQNVTSQIATAERQLESYKGTKYRLEGLGKDVQYSGGLASQSWIGSGVAIAGSMASSASGKVKELTASIGQVIGRIPIIGRAAKEAAYIGKSAFSGMKVVMEKVSPVIQKAGGAFASLIKRFVSGIPIIGKLAGATNKSNNSFGFGLKNVLKYAFGIRSLYVLFNKLRSAMTEGFKNLAQYDDETNKSLSMLSSSLTQLKNSLATAFAPILNYIAPALNTLIQLVVKAANTIGQFFASLTGKSYAVQATGVNKDYAASLNSSTSAANGATEANEKLKQSLMGFDEINKLNDDDSNNSKNSDVSFDTSTVNSGVSSFAQSIKDAWENADFTSVGATIGTKLNEALDSISWDGIKEKARNIATSIGTFLNGFIQETDWSLVGSTIGNGIQTAIEFSYTAINTFDWKNLGKAIADSFMGLWSSINWAKAGQTLSDGVTGILDTITIAIEGVDWQEVGNDIAVFIENIDWTGVTKAICRGIGAAIGAIGGVIVGFLKEKALSDINYFAEETRKNVEECGGDIIKGLLLGIHNGIMGIGDWIVNNIFTPFIEGFKNAFGIHSPSTVMEEQGGFIIGGLLQGLRNNIQKVYDWFIDLPNKIKAAVGDLSVTLQTKVASIKDVLQESYSKAVAWAKNNFKFEFRVTYKTSGLGTIKKAIVNALGLEGWPSFKFFAGGGFPQKGQMFVANEAGPEMIGTMDGKTAVANNNQITTGIASAVYPAVYNAVIAAFSRFGGNNNQVIKVYVGDKEITDYFVEYVKSQTKTTGVNPVMI